MKIPPLVFLLLFTSHLAAQKPAEHFADVFIGHYVVMGTDEPYAIIWADDDSKPNYGVGFGRVAVRKDQKVWTVGKTAKYVVFKHDATGGGKMDQYWLATKADWDAHQNDLAKLLPLAWNFKSFNVSRILKTPVNKASTRNTKPKSTKRKNANSKKRKPKSSPPKKKKNVRKKKGVENNRDSNQRFSVCDLQNAFMTSGLGGYCDSTFNTVMSS